jgi:hypothetical protein
LRAFGKPGGERSIASCVSHVSHRDVRKACGKEMVCVNSVSEALQGKGLEETGDAQWAGIRALLFRSDGRWEEFGLSQSWRFPAMRASKKSSRSSTWSGRRDTFVSSFDLAAT